MVANGHRGTIYNDPISISVYNAFFNTYTKFVLLSQSGQLLRINFLLCHPTIWLKAVDINYIINLHFNIESINCIVQTSLEKILRRCLK